MKITTIGLFIICALNLCVSQEMAFPKEHWQQYQTPEEAGFSTQKLKLLEDSFTQNGGDVLLVIHNGIILMKKGPTSRRFRQASIRKSYLSALFGRYVRQGVINLEDTMADLNIDDLQPLTEEEQKARVIDLLSARSGIYLPAAYTLQSNIDRMPPRGSHAPGTFWYYNNWDFNTLLTIFNQQTGQDFFETFKKEIADPLGMEDFRLFDTYYRQEDSVSKHPAYLFKMSARDMARFGLLFLNEGRWQKEQLIPQSWVEQSTSVHTEDLGPDFDHKGSYGLLWWISDDIKGERMYYASGAGGQRICILPQSQLVLVHLTDTYQRKGVRDAQIQQMVELLLDAKSGDAIAHPTLLDHDPQGVEVDKISPDPAFMAKIAGVYHHRFLGEFKIQPKKDKVVMTTGIGRFNLYPIEPDTFFVEDMEIPCQFKPGEEAQKHTIEAILDDDRMVTQVIFYY